MGMTRKVAQDIKLYLCGDDTGLTDPGKTTFILAGSSFKAVIRTIADILTCHEIN